jgi:hypothetical protein
MADVKGGSGAAVEKELQAAQGQLIMRAEGEERGKRLRWLEFSGGTERNGTGHPRRPWKASGGEGVGAGVKERSTWRRFEF